MSPTNGTNIDLLWRGPFQIGNLKSRVGNKLSEFVEPHVYCTVCEYDGSRNGSLNIIYLGKAQNFYIRMFQHYRGFLGFEYLLRDDGGQLAYKVTDEEYFDWMDDIDYRIKAAIDEAKRVQFFCARCELELLNIIESALINRLKDRAKENLTGPLKCDNSRREWHGWNGKHIAINNIAHDDFPSAGKFIERAFGDDLIEWGEEK